ncbi:acyltransferase family protein [Nocardiopsis sp. NPDC049922]|uniref:acyltransferase family protein n=1 Tax=Nocardiopsis sp. NPDC049922 TaxID=3155157 RepID=UPI003402140A
MSVTIPGAPATVSPVPSVSTRSTVRTGAGFRPEIEGLRAVAVVLVAVYHVWFGRVSGGVDVFLLLTGFLITGSLVRSLERDGRVAFVAFWSRLAGRLTPAALTVLAGTLVATFLWLPGSRWSDILREVRAAALYHENWALAAASVDYLAREAAPSPVQHFWSLSIQGQFYVVWPLLLALTALVAARVRLPLRTALLTVVATVFAVSLGYSVWITGTNQAWAYFDSGARAWELALGAVLALVVTRVRLPVAVRVPMGWTGLAVLVACGAVLPVATLFPGYVALVPTGAAVLVILAGTTGSPFGADRLLTWRPLVRLGSLSYAFYLWHWPVLVCYLHLTDRGLADLAGGSLVLALSLVLAWLTSRLVEDGARRLTRAPRRATPAWSLGVAAAFLVPVLAVSASWSAHIAREQRVRAEQAAEEVSEPARYPGALVLSDERSVHPVPNLPVLPDPADARADLSSHHTDGCHVGLTSTELVVCERGPADAERTLAIVGASRTAHWYPAVATAAARQGWRLVSFTKSGCQFSADVPMRDGAVFTECQEWDALAMEELERLRPDAVLTSSTRAAPGNERVPPGFVERWRRLEELGIDVVGLRDLPRRDYAGAECVESRPLGECTSPASYSQAAADPAARTDLPDNVRVFDLTAYVCPEGACDAVVGNMLVFWDRTHMTATYSRTLAPMMEEGLLEATGW